MPENSVFRLDKPQKNGRLDKYSKELSLILKRKDVSSLEHFMGKVFKDCMDYLRKILRVNFPELTLKIIYKEKEYAQLCNKLDKEFGPKPRTKAVIVGSGSEAVINIDFQGHFKSTPIDFIANLSVSYLEELVHSTYPHKSETEIHELVCSVVEGFLEIKLPNSVKKERLRRARIYNGQGKL